MKVDINNMPEAIKDDCLMDTVVEIFYRTDFSKDYLENLILNGLAEKFGESVFNKIPVVVNGVVKEGLWFIANNQFRIMIDNAIISFNIVDKYPKWEAYSSFIKYVLSLMKNNNVFFSKTSIRYVSLFGNVELARMIDGTLKMNQLIAFEGSQYRFQCDVNDDNGHVVARAEVQLSDRYRLSEHNMSSIIDVRVWCDSLSEDNNYDGLLAALDMAHRHQKHLFFLLLSESFYNELKV